MSDKTTRCTGMNKDGTRCKRMTAHGSRCALHTRVRDLIRHRAFIAVSISAVIAAAATGSAYVAFGQWKLSQKARSQQLDSHVESLVQEAFDILSGDGDSTPIVHQITTDAKDLESAHRLLQEAERLRPEYWRALSVRSLYFAGKRMDSMATELSERAIEAAPSRPEVYINAALLALGRDQLDAAIEYSERGSAVSDSPSLAPVHALALVKRGGAGDRTEAVQLLERVHRSAPYDTQVASQLATLYAGDSRFSEAIQLYESVVAREPSNWRDRSNLSRLYSLVRWPDLARRAAEQGIRINDGDAQLHFQHGLALDSLEDDAAAEEAYLRCVELRPRHPDAYINLGNMYSDQGRFEDADRVLGHAELLFASDADVLHSRAYLEYCRGELGLSLGALDKAIALGGENENRREFRAHLVSELARIDTPKPSKSNTQAESLPQTSVSTSNDAVDDSWHLDSANSVVREAADVGPGP